MNALARLTLVTWLALPAFAHPTMIYRCIRSDGSTHFSDRMIVDSACEVITSGAAIRPPAAEPARRPEPDPGSLRGQPDAFTAPATPAPIQPLPPITPGAFDFIDERGNLLEFRRGKAMAAFHRKWSNPAPSSIVVAHFGDSHIQNGWLLEVVRNRLQAVRGNAGRGMVFPYAIARTYSQNDYSSSFSGVWVSANSIEQTPKIPVGVAGFAARTRDPSASFTLDFKRAPDPGAKRVRVFVQGASGHSLTLTSGQHRQSVRLTMPQTGGMPFVEFRLPEIGSSLRFEIGIEESPSEALDILGVSIENESPGVMVHNLGVGGANFGALLAQRLFAEHFRAIKPDLVVLDWGTNDIIYRNQIPEKHIETVEASIRAIRAVDPETVIVLTSVQDMNYRGRPVSVAAEYSALMREIALRNDCVFYDWYRIAGGAGSMRYWAGNGLASKDHVHLTGRGYQLKGELFARALMRSLDRLGSLGQSEETAESSVLAPPAAPPTGASAAAPGRLASAAPRNIAHETPRRRNAAARHAARSRKAKAEPTARAADTTARRAGKSAPSRRQAPRG